MYSSRRSVLKMVGGSITAAGLSACVGGRASTTPSAEPIGASAIPNLLQPFDVISTGHNWTEGPVWWPEGQGSLLYSDVPGNTIYSWDGKKAAVFMQPSGYEGVPIPAHIREAGSNGLALGRGGLLIADSGSRCVSIVDLRTLKKTVIASHFGTARLNSPNDLVVARNGDIYFTDPPYGLVGVNDSPLRELKFTGVFRITPDNRLHLVTDKLFPNGIGLSPDNRTLYVTDRSGWIAIELDANGVPVGQSLLVAAEAVGGRGDGFKVDARGRLWCSGPGGIHVFSPDGRRIGFSPITGRVSNCAFGPDGILYVTNADRVLRGRFVNGFV